jgi:hypothetical protein
MVVDAVLVPVIGPMAVVVEAIIESPAGPIVDIADVVVANVDIVADVNIACPGAIDADVAVVDAGTIAGPATDDGTIAWAVTWTVCRKISRPRSGPVKACAGPIKTSARSVKVAETGPVARAGARDAAPAAAGKRGTCGRPR